MAEIKLPTMSYKELGEQGARYALDEVEYEGLTIRQWVGKIVSGEYAPKVHAHWSKEMMRVTNAFGDIHIGFQCSCCKGIFNKTLFCGGCGATMDEEAGGSEK